MLSKVPGKEIKAYLTNYVVIDIETTGLSSEKDEIITIICSKVKNGEVVERFCSFAKPTVSISVDVSKLTGITNEMIRECDEIRDVLPDFLNFIWGDEVIIGCNTSFDLSFLNKATEQLCGKQIGNDYIDIRNIAKELLPQLKHYNLASIAENLGIQIQKDLSSMDYCDAVNAIYKSLCQKEGIFAVDRTVIDEEIEQICKSRVKELFGDSPDFEIRKRLKRELEAIKKYQHAPIYMMWRNAVQISAEKGFYTGFQGAIGSSFVAYLCGITEINPLSEENGGYQIPVEVFMGLDLDKRPDININVASSMYKPTYHYINECPGVIISNFVNQNSYPDFDYYKVRDSSLIINKYYDMLHYLEEITKVKVNSIPLDDEKVMGVICDRNINEINNLPDFGKLETRKIISVAEPKNFEDLIKIYLLEHGTKVWFGNQEELVQQETISLPDCIASRDDIFIYLTCLGISKKDAYQIMESVRKGKGLTDKMKQIMRAENIPEWYIRVCEQIRYLFPKAHAVSFSMLAVRLGYYMVYFPDLYEDAVAIHGRSNTNR